MVKMLICGSREVSSEMLHVARFATVRARDFGARVIVGDAHGVDEAVARACIEFAIPFTVYGITRYPRNLGTAYTGEYVRVNGNYLARDRVMSNLCDCCIAVWNGSSRGTRYTYEHALSQRKRAILWNFGGGNGIKKNVSQSATQER